MKLVLGLKKDGNGKARMRRVEEVRSRRRVGSTMAMLTGDGLYTDSFLEDSGENQSWFSRLLPVPFIL